MRAPRLKILHRGRYDLNLVEYVDNGTVFGKLVSNLEEAHKTRRLLTLRVEYFSRPNRP